MNARVCRVGCSPSGPRKARPDWRSPPSIDATDDAPPTRMAERIPSFADGGAVGYSAGFNPPSQ